MDWILELLSKHVLRQRRMMITNGNALLEIFGIFILFLLREHCRVISCGGEWNFWLFCCYSVNFFFVTSVNIRRRLSMSAKEFSLLEFFSLLVMWVVLRIEGAWSNIFLINQMSLIDFKKFTNQDLWREWKRFVANVLSHSMKRGRIIITY